MARVLVTGGAGYVGSHCAKALAAAGHNGIVFDNLTFGHREFVRWCPLVEGDIRDPTALDAIFRAHRIDAVMHFAALARLRNRKCAVHIAVRPVLVLEYNSPLQRTGNAFVQSGIFL